MKAPSILTATLIRDSIRIVEEKTTLIDKSKDTLCTKADRKTSTQPQMASFTLLISSSTKLSECWALRASKKSKHFNENQKFKLGQETGYKEDPSQVASDMRRAKNENGERRFAVGEFLSPQQIKSYFSRSAAKIKQADRWQRSMYQPLMRKWHTPQLISR